MNYADIIAREAYKNGLPPELVTAIIAVESSGNPTASRYEPGFYERYILPLADDGLTRPPDTTRATERRHRATSWGLMQVMGQVARELGYTGDLPALVYPATNIMFGCKLLAQLAKTYAGRPDKWAAVASAYNGGRGAPRGPGIEDDRNPEYAAKVLDALGGGWPA